MADKAGVDNRQRDEVLQLADRGRQKTCDIDLFCRTRHQLAHEVDLRDVLHVTCLGANNALGPVSPRGTARVESSGWRAPEPVGSVECVVDVYPSCAVGH